MQARLPVLLTSSLLAVLVHAQELRIGDPIPYSLDLPAADSVIIVEPPDLPVRILPLNVRQVKQGGKFGFSAAAYDTGAIDIPALAVLVLRAGQVADTVWTVARTVTIVSTLPDTASAPRPIKPYEEHPLRFADVVREYWLWFVGALFLAALAYAYIRYRNRPKLGAVMADPPPLPPAELAVRELIALRDKRFPERGMMKEQYSEFSEVMRRYVEGRYVFPALEMTTYELAIEFRRDELPRCFHDELLPLLRMADLVKFAKEIPTLAAANALVETGFTIVEQTKPLDIVPAESTAP